MNGYYESNKGVLKIEVTNVGAFKELLEKARKEADQLSSTIGRLEKFDLSIEFSGKKTIEE